MALELKYASDATVLLTDLVDSLGRPSSPAGVVVPVLMPSLPLVDRTKAELARRHGVAMGVEFLLPGSFIERMARLVGPCSRTEGHVRIDDRRHRTGHSSGACSGAADGRRRASGSARALRRFERRCHLVGVTDAVLARVRRPFPVEPIRPLDAVHLATTEVLGEPSPLIVVVTRDTRVRENAEALGYAVA